MATGERTFEALGKSWTLVFDFNAMCRIEETYDMGFVEFVQRRIFPQVAAEDLTDAAKVAAAGARIRFTDIRAVLQAGLKEHHPAVTGNDVGKIIDEIKLGGATEIVAEAIKSAMGAEAGDEGDANPPKKAKAKKPTG